MRSIILLHGAIGASDQLDQLAKELQIKGYSTYQLDFSGHGSASFQKEFTIKQFALELTDFIKSKNLEKPDVFGYSMGGYVALYLASQQPNLLGNIITLGTKFLWTPEIAAKEIKMLDTKTIIEKVPKFAEALQKRHDNNWELLLQRTAEMMMQLGVNNILSQEQFSKIENKVLIGLADNDNMVSVSETDNAASLIKRSERFTLLETKHPIETVDPKSIVQRIHQFLS